MSGVSDSRKTSILKIHAGADGRLFGDFVQAGVGAVAGEGLLGDFENAVAVAQGVGAGLAVGRGARAIVLTNRKGAVLELSGWQVGLLANADLSGLAITLN